MSKKQTTNKPGWLFDKQGNIRNVHLPVNSKGETISLNPITLFGKIPDNVGFSMNLSKPIKQTAIDRWTGSVDLAR